MRYITFLMGVDVDSKEELENFASALTPIQNGHLKYLFIMNSMVLHFDTDVPYDELKLFIAELCKEYNFFYILQEFPDKMSLNFDDVDAKHLFDLSVWKKILIIQLELNLILNLTMVMMKKKILTMIWYNN